MNSKSVLWLSCLTVSAKAHYNGWEMTGRVHAVLVICRWFVVVRKLMHTWRKQRIRVVQQWWLSAHAALHLSPTLLWARLPRYVYCGWLTSLVSCHLSVQYQLQMFRVLFLSLTVNEVKCFGFQYSSKVSVSCQKCFLFSRGSITAFVAFW